MPTLKLLLFAATCAFSSVCAAQTVPETQPTTLQSRFAGSAKLIGPAGVSPDGRFRSDAALMPPGTPPFSTAKAPERSNLAPLAPKVYAQTGGRFGLDAALVNPDRSKAVAVDCTAPGGDIFKNGFE